MLKNVDGLLACAATDAEVEATVGLAVNQSRKSAGFDAVAVAKAVSKAAGRPLLRFRVLCGLYGQVAAAADKLAVLLLAVEVGRSVGGDATRVIETAFADLGSGVSELEQELDVKGRRTLLKALAESFSSSEVETRRAQSFRLRYLRALDETAAPAASDVALAAECARDALRDPFTWFRERQDLLSIKAVKALEKSTKEHKQLYSLLVVFATKQFAELVAFAEANSSSFSDLKLDRVKLESDMRLLSLCALAAEAETVSYAAIANALVVPAADVETWVVKALTNDLIECKMDQLLKVFISPASFIEMGGM